MFTHLLIQASEDGNPVSFLDAERLAELLADPVASHGIRRFISMEEMSDGDPNYWPEGDGLLLRIEPAMSFPKAGPVGETG